MITLLLVLPLFGCGKKSEKDHIESATRAMKDTGEVNFELNNDLKTSLEENNFSLFKEVLRKNPSLDLNKILNDGETLLTTVIKKDYRPFRDLLLEKGASIERANASKETPLISAAMSKGINTVRVLMDLNVDLNKKDIAGLTALHHAIIMIDDASLTPAQRKEYEAVAILLVKAGASVEVTTPEDRNAFRLAIDHHGQALQELIKSIMEIEYGTPDVNTFKSVLKTGDTKSLNFMLTRYPSMPLTYEEINPLVLALEYENEIATLRMLQLLIAYKANVNGPANAEVTPLIKAVKMQNKGFVVLLIDSKANTQIKDKEGKSALYYAINMKNDELTGILARAGAEIKYLYRENGVKFSFDACKLVKNIESTSISAEEKEKAAAMKKTLNCRSLFRSLF